MPFLTHRPAAATLVLLAFCMPAALVAEEANQDPPATADSPADQKPAGKLPTIPDEPKTIDPATLLPEPLGRRATCDLTESSIAEHVEWLNDQPGVTAILDERALASVGLPPSERLSDRLRNDPIYLLLNRFAARDLAWYLEDGIVVVTIPEQLDAKLSTTPHNVGNLLDEGYEADDLLDLIESTVAPNSWETVGGPGTLSILGDVLFVRQIDPIQRRVRGLLGALRDHGRMTFVLDGLDRNLANC